jgi:CheY-like chemotaxis protein
VSEALAKLSSGPRAFDVLLVDKDMVSGRTRDRQQLLEACKELPWILMGADPQPQDVFQGIQLGAVDFLAKPLSPLKLRNIWQHTVRKMISSMNINCTSELAQDMQQLAAAAAAEAATQQQQQQVAAVEATAAAAAAVAAATAAATPDSMMSDEGEETDAEMAALEEKVGHPGKQLVAACASSAPGSPALSRAGSANLAVKPPIPPSSSSLPASPEKQAMAGRPLAAGLTTCPSTSSLKSCTLAGLVPMGMLLGGGAADGAAGPCSSAGSDGRLTPVPGTTTSSAVPTPSSSPAPTAAAAAQGVTSSGRTRRPSLKAAAAAAAAATTKAAPAAPAAAAAAPVAPTSVTLPYTPLASVPLPTGLGPLPAGMVWGMPMCPMARAPGIVPPAGTAAAAPLPWGMPSAAGPLMGPAGLMAAGAGPMGPMGLMPPFGIMGMPMPMAPAAMGQAAGGCAAAAPAPAAPAAAAAPGTGAATAAALNASLSMADGLLDSSSLQLMLGDVAAEDDLDEMIQDDLGLKDGLPAPFGVLQDLETTAKGLCTLQAPLNAALEADLAAEAGKASAAQAFTSTKGAAAAPGVPLARMGSLASTRSSFESVTSTAGAHMATLSRLRKVDSFSDLFGSAAAPASSGSRSGDGATPASSEGDMGRMDASMLEELDTLFGAASQEQGDADGLFGGLEVPAGFPGMKKTDSFADILSGGLGAAA